MPIAIRSYNILSNHLTDRFARCAVENLHNETRFARILSKLEQSVDEHAVICLQELSRDWSGRFHSFFEKKGYSMVDSLYGQKNNGYMGIAVAYPLEVYSAIDIDVFRVADSLPPIPRTEQKPSWWSWLPFPKGNTEAPHDPWKIATGRYNTGIFVRFASKLEVDRPNFCVANYHMPCAYYCPPVLTIHTSEMIHQSQEYAKGDPLVVAGDWNIKADSPFFQMITTGKIDASSEVMPPKHGDWTPRHKPMKSTYSTINGKEPLFTNYPGGATDFCETLDYLFHTDSFAPISVIELPTSTNNFDLLPSATEPSDHLLIGADYEIKK